MGFLKDWHERFFKNDGGQDKNKSVIQNIIIFLAIGIVMLLAGGFFNDLEKKTVNKENQNIQDKITSVNGYLDEYDAMMENKIKNILSEINGVGKVSVAITYASSKELVPAQDTTQNESNTNERDKEGGVRNTSQVDTDSKVIVSQQTDAKPVILKELPPTVRGVVVVADGAKDPVVKTDISRAVTTSLGISLSRVQVFSRAGN